VALQIPAFFRLSIFPFERAGPGHEPDFLPGYQNPPAIGTDWSFTLGVTFVVLLGNACAAFLKKGRLNGGELPGKNLIVFLTWFALPWLPLLAQRILITLTIGAWGTIVLTGISGILYEFLKRHRARLFRIAAGCLATWILLQGLALAYDPGLYLDFIYQNEWPKKFKHRLEKHALILGTLLVLLFVFVRTGYSPDLRPTRLTGRLPLTGIRLPGFAAGAMSLFCLLIIALLVFLDPFFGYRNELIAFALIVTGSVAVMLQRIRFPEHTRGLLLTISAAMMATLIAWIFARERFHQFFALVFDFSFEYQAIHNIAFLGIPHLSLGEKDGLFDRIYFADHTPILYYLVALLYRLYPEPTTLIFLQALAISGGAVPLYLLARDQLNAMSALFLTMAYLLFPAAQIVTQWDLHAYAFAVPIFLSAFYFYHRDRWPLTLLLFTLAGMAREDAPLLVIAFGLTLLPRRTEVRRGVAILGLGFVQFFLLGNVVQAYFGGVPNLGRLAPLFYHSGEYNLAGYLKTFLLNPAFAARTILTWDRIAFLMHIFVPLAFLPLFSGRRILILLAGASGTVLGGHPALAITGMHYAIPLWIGAFYAAIFGLKNASAWISEHPANLKNVQLRISSGIAAAALLSFFFFSPFFPGRKILNFMGRSSAHPAEFLYRDQLGFFRDFPRTLNPNIRRALQMIPEDARVSTHRQLHPHVTGRRYAYELPRIDDADYILLCLSLKEASFSREAFAHPYFRILYTDNDVSLLKRVAAPERFPK